MTVGWRLKTRYQLRFLVEWTNHWLPVLTFATSVTVYVASCPTFWTPKRGGKMWPWPYGNPAESRDTPSITSGKYGDAQHGGFMIYGLNVESWMSHRVCRRFEGLVAQGKSPTVELLNDWGTTNCTVGDLVDILKSHKLLAAASLLLPGMI